MISTDPREYYMETDRSYYYKVLGIEYISKCDNQNNNEVLNTYVDSEKKLKNNKSKKIKYKFGDILSQYGTKEKLVFICSRNRFIYACNLESLEVFNGMKRINLNNISGVYDILSFEDKERLLLKLSAALEIDKHIPIKIKDEVQALVKRYNSTKKS